MAKLSVLDLVRVRDKDCEIGIEIDALMIERAQLQRGDLDLDLLVVEKPRRAIGSFTPPTSPHPPPARSAPDHAQSR